MCRGRVWLWLVSAVLAGCSYPEKAKDWNAGGSGGEEPSVVSVAFIKSRYRGYPYTFSENYRIRGCVVSTDRSGNYHKALSVADATGAIELKIDCERLFERYMMGCIVDISCNGLTIGSSGGMLQLGTAPVSEYETGYISAEDLETVVRVTGFADERVEASMRTIDGLDIPDVGMLVAFGGVQFEEGGSGMMWCDPDEGDPSGFRDADREIKDAKGNTLTVRTSRYAEFASWTLPAGSGSIEGILTVYNGKFQLRVIKPEFVYSSMTRDRF